MLRRAAPWVLSALIGCSNPAGKDSTTDGGDSSVGDTDGTDNPTAHLTDEQGRYLPVELELYEREYREFQGYDTVYSLPDPIVGVIFFFHGSGGDINLVENVEVTYVLNEMFAAGIGFIATNSTDRDSATWDRSDLSLETNPDLSRLAFIRDQLIAEDSLSDDTATFGMGFSNGAAFASVFGYATFEAGWPTRAISMHNSGPTRNLPDGLPIPAAFIVAENDESVNNDSLFEEYENHIAAGQDGLFKEAEEIPLHETRFARIEHFNYAESLEAWTSCVNYGLIDTQGIRQIDLDDLTDELNGWKAVFNNDYDVMAGAQIRVVWATHRFDGRYGIAERDFFLDAL